MADLIGEEIPEGVKISGKIKLTYDDATEDGFPITANGNAKFTVNNINDLFNASDLYGEDYDEELDEELDNFELLGFISGECILSNVKIISEENFSGSVSYNITCGLNIANKETQQWAKCIMSLTLTSNLGKKNATAKASIKIYGDGSNPLLSDTITIKLSNL